MREGRKVSFNGILGGSWVVISGVMSRVTIVITHVRGLITQLITTHEPPSKGYGFRVITNTRPVEEMSVRLPEKEAPFRATGSCSVPKACVLELQPSSRNSFRLVLCNGVSSETASTCVCLGFEGWLY